MGARSQFHSRFAARFRSLVLVAFLGVAGSPFACSSTNDGGSVACGTTRCGVGQKCIDDGSGAACRTACTGLGDCPFGTFCNDGSPTSWCVANTSAVSPMPSGQWGAACIPTHGEANNPACDVGNGFACYGKSPTDANAFCTLFGCQLDSDCAGGWWCATTNRMPNVATSKASFGGTRPVCLPRGYCAPCHLDHDCLPLADGTAQHCVTDAKGSSFCAPTCGGDGNCALDATCQNWQSLCKPAAGAACRSDDDCPPLAGVAQHCDAARCTPECGSDADCRGPGDAGALGDAGAPGACRWQRVCHPRAGVCVGNGGFCSPCRSDADCTDGFCMSGMPYSSERFCSLKSTVPRCDATVSDPTGCPTRKPTDNWGASACTTTPANQCEGLVVLGRSTGQPIQVPGCWTVNR